MRLPLLLIAIVCLAVDAPLRAVHLVAHTALTASEPPVRHAHHQHHDVPVQPESKRQGGHAADHSCCLPPMIDLPVTLVLSRLAALRAAYLTAAVVRAQLVPLPARARDPPPALMTA